MKPVRTIVVFGAGVAAGLALAKRMLADDPDVLHGSSQQRASNPALRAASSGLAKMGDLATVASLDAIKRARGRIRRRLDEPDDIAWG
jgi:predicted dinucleotide-binding enzyme